MGAMPEQIMPLSRAGIVLFGQSGVQSDLLSVNVDVHTEPRMVAWLDPEYPEFADEAHRIAPSFYTEWLDMPRGALAGRGLNAMDGFGFDYDADAPDAPPESPGAIYQDDHALFRRATMQLRHRGDGLYDVRAEGVTAFDWTFSLDAIAPLERVVFRAGRMEDARAPMDAVVEEFERHFDPAVFEGAWVQRGSGANTWYDFIAVARAAAR